MPEENTQSTTEKKPAESSGGGLAAPAPSTQPETASPEQPVLGSAERSRGEPAKPAPTEKPSSEQPLTEAKQPVQEQPEPTAKTLKSTEEKTPEPATEKPEAEKKQETPETSKSKPIKEMQKPDISSVQPVPAPAKEPLPPAEKPAPISTAQSIAEKPAATAEIAETAKEPTAPAEKTAVQPPKPRIISPAPNSPIIKPILSFLDKLKELRQKANLARKKNKQGNLEKIMAFAREKQKITNNDVEKLTGVKDRQATNYLTELTKNGLLMRFGQKKNTFYKPIKK